MNSTTTPTPKFYVIDLRHYVTEDGALPTSLPQPTTTTAYLCGAVVG